MATIKDLKQAIQEAEDRLQSEGIENSEDVEVRDLSTYFSGKPQLSRIEIFVSNNEVYGTFIQITIEK